MGMEDELEQRAADYLSSVLGFNGERIDPVLGGYHLGNGYRLYNPSLRRFTSPDSMSPFGQGGINPYAYCEGDPINNTDPTGHFGLGIFSTFLMVATALIPGGEEAKATEMAVKDVFDVIANDNNRRDEHLATEALKDAASKAIAPEGRPSTSSMRPHSPATPNGLRASASSAHEPGSMEHMINSIEDPEFDSAEYYKGMLKDEIHDAKIKKESSRNRVSFLSSLSDKPDLEVGWISRREGPIFFREYQAMKANNYNVAHELQIPNSYGDVIRTGIDMRLSGRELNVLSNQYEQSYPRFVSLWLQALGQI